MPDRPIRILELRSVTGTGGGPEKTILCGAALADRVRFAITVCYVRDRDDRGLDLRAMASRLGVDYVEILERHAVDPAIWLTLLRLVRDRRIDLVHSHDYKTDLLALLVARQAGITPMATAHGWTGHTARERLVYYPADRWLLRHFPMVVAVSEEIRQTLLESGCRPDRVVTVLNGIDPTVFSRRQGLGAAVRDAWRIPSTATVVGAVGRLEPQKRFDLLIDAFADVRRTHPDLRLVIVGDGSQRKSLTTLVAQRGLDTCCMLAGYRTDIVEVLHAIDLFVQASSYEGTPNAVLEAMATGTPVVATKVGGTGHLIDDRVHGLLVPPGRHEALARAMTEALDDPRSTACRAVAARRRIEQELSFDARMRAVERIVEQLVERTSAPRTTVLA